MVTLGQMDVCGPELASVLHSHLNVKSEVESSENDYVMKSRLWSFLLFSVEFQYLFFFEIQGPITMTMGV